MARIDARLAELRAHQLSLTAVAAVIASQAPDPAGAAKAMANMAAYGLDQLTFSSGDAAGNEKVRQKAKEHAAAIFEEAAQFAAGSVKTG